MDLDYSFAHYIVPGCCQLPRSMMAGEDRDNVLAPVVFLAHVNKTDYKGREQECKPVWKIMAVDPFGSFMSVVVEFCPLCGKKLPEIVRRKKKPEKIMAIRDGGYYCNTCKQRLQSCECYPPVFHWEPKT